MKYLFIATFVLYSSAIIVKEWLHNKNVTMLGLSDDVAPEEFLNDVRSRINLN